MINMKISTKGRYALVIMIDLAKEYNSSKYLSLRDIAEKENMSLKYLEKLMLNLNKADYFLSLRGAEGGYRLKYAPDQYKIGDILRLAEGNLDVTDCVSNDGKCSNSHNCSTYRLWKELNDLINDYLDSKTLADYI